jgi:hypothetical protein
MRQGLLAGLVDTIRNDVLGPLMCAVLKTYVVHQPSCFRPKAHHDLLFRYSLLSDRVFHQAAARSDYAVGIAVRSSFAVHLRHSTICTSCTPHRASHVSPQTAAWTESDRYRQTLSSPGLLNSYLSLRLSSRIAPSVSCVLWPFLLYCVFRPLTVVRTKVEG